MEASLRIAEAADAAALNRALARLSADLGDTHAVSDETLARAGWEAPPAFRAVLAERGAEILGLALYSPCFSTTRGGAGIFVSDLWAAPEARGQGLGRRLLAAALEDGAATWGAGFIRLSAYHASTGAMRFYTALGFRPLASQHDLVLDGSGCDELRSER